MLENPKELRKTVRSHIMIYVLVLFLTGLSVGIHFMDMEPRNTAVLVFAVAGIQIFLITQFLMHLVTEDRPIYGIAAFTVLTLAGLIILTIATHQNTYEGAISTGMYAPTTESPDH